jgi:hypothetical protein
MDYNFLIPKFKYKNGWTIKPKLQGDPIYAQYVKDMAEAQRKIRPPKPKPVKPEGMSDEEFIYSLQCKSTQEIIEKQKDPNYKRDWSAPLPDNWLANPDAKDHDELVGSRINELDQQQVSHVEAIRRRSKNTLGQSQESAFSQERRDAAVHAFMVSPPALLSKEEMDQITTLTPKPKAIPASIPKEEKKKEPKGLRISIAELIGWKK